MCTTGVNTDYTETRGQTQVASSLLQRWSVVRRRFSTVPGARAWLFLSSVPCAVQFALKLSFRAGGQVMPPSVRVFHPLGLLRRMFARREADCVLIEPFRISRDLGCVTLTAQMPCR